MLIFQVKNVDILSMRVLKLSRLDVVSSFDFELLLFFFFLFFKISDKLQFVEFFSLFFAQVLFLSVLLQKIWFHIRYLHLFSKAAVQVGKPIFLKLTYVLLGFLAIRYFVQIFV